ncbi:MAG: hypothetical protein HYY16_14165 [Planctomycetes bacterium]|nr:hypothetical protein [Planctomycetota bacterium]
MKRLLLLGLLTVAACKESRPAPTSEQAKTTDSTSPQKIAVAVKGEKYEIGKFLVPRHVTVVECAAAW